MAKTEKRIETVDMLRGFAALAVCWFHLTDTNAIAGSGVLEKSGRYGWLGVEIFFVISGFIIPYALHRSSYTLRHFGRFLLKRITRLDPPYIVSIVIAIIVGYLETMAPHYQGPPFHPGIIRTLLNLGYLNVLVGYPWLNTVYWTLAIEFQYYLMIGLAFPLISSHRRVLRILFFVLLSLLAFKITFPGFIFHFIFLFFMGIALFQHQAGIIKRREFFVLLPIFTLGAYLTLGLPPTIAGLAVVTAISRLRLRNRIFIFLGSISYSLYLFHPPVIKVIYTLGRRFATTDARQTAVILMALAATIVSAYVLYLLIERPAQRWSAQFKYVVSPTVDLASEEHSNSATGSG